MNAVRAEHLRVRMDYRVPLERLIRASRVRLELPNDEDPEPGRYRIQELRTIADSGGLTNLLLMPIERPRTDAPVELRSIAVMPPERGTTFRHALCAVSVMDAPRPACVHCTGWRVLVTDPNVRVWDIRNESEIVPIFAVLTDVPVWPTVRLMLHHRLAAVLHSMPAHVLLRA